MSSIPDFTTVDLGPLPSGPVDTTAWAAAVRTVGALPMYITTWDNHASQRVAAALGAVRFGVDFQLY